MKDIFTLVVFFFLSCLTGCSAIPKEDGDTTVSYAWEQIILEHGDYDISIETPGKFNGEPPSGVDWSTIYENQNTNLSVNIDFYFREDSFLEQKSNLKTEGIVLSDITLWERQACYYLKSRELVTDENETLENEIIIALIPLENDTYIEVEMIGKGEGALGAEKLLEDEAFQDAVIIEISEHE